MNVQLPKFFKQYWSLKYKGIAPASSRGKLKLYEKSFKRKSIDYIWSTFEINWLEWLPPHRNYCRIGVLPP